MEIERSFPRGGRNEKAGPTHRKHHDDDNEDLFKILKSPRKFKKPSKKSKQKKNDEAQVDDTEFVSVENLTSKTLLSDMLVLACLRDVGDYSMTVSLPGGLTGKLPVTNISDKYTELLQMYSQDPQAMQENISTLSSMYEVGSCFPMRVINHIKDPTTSASSTTLSINPRDVNKDISPSSWYQGMHLLASVQSVEDHGYVMDIHVGNMQGFLSKLESQAPALSVGQTVLCSVNMPKLTDSDAAKQRVLTLTCKRKAINTILNFDETQVRLNCLLPGCNVKCTIMEARKTGLVVKCSQFSGCVYRDHLQGVLDDPTKYQIGQEVVGVVLYQQAITNNLHLSLASKINPKTFKTMFSGLKYGEVIDDAMVINVSKSRVYFKLNNKVKALAKFGFLVGKQEQAESAADLYHVGEKHKCRILGFDYMDRMVLISLRKDNLTQVWIDKDDIQIGKVFSGIVEEHVERGVKVRLGKGSFGLVQYLHLTDQETTFPKRLLPPGSKVQCRVLRVDKLGNYVSPLLTCKSTLVNSTLPVLSSYEQAKVGDLYHGVVMKASKHGVLLSFYNDIKGFVPVGDLSTEYIEYPEQVFFVGKVVKALVTSCYPDRHRLYLSLKLDTNKPFGQKEMANDGKLRVGHVISVKVIGKKPEGFDVKLVASGLKGFLPVGHLSDHPRLCMLFFELYEVGDVISALCFNTIGTIIVSKKRTLHEAVKLGQFVYNWRNLKPGQLVPGVIKAFLSYGIFVQLGGSFCGLVHKKNLLDSRVNEPGSIGYVTHQTVTAKVLDIHPDTHHISLSTRLSDVCGWPSKQEDSVQWLDNFLKDWKEIALLNKEKDVFKDLAVLKVGSVVLVTIKSVTREGVLCETTEGVAGIVTNQNIGEGKPVLEMCTEAVVLHLDLKNNCAEFSICPRLVAACKKNDKKSGLSHLVGQSVQGTVLLIRTHFVLVALLTPAQGILAYIPSLRHPNDLVGIAYETGGNVYVSVVKACKRFVIGSKCKEETVVVKRKTECDRNKKSAKRRKLEITFDEDVGVTPGTPTMSSPARDPVIQDGIVTNFSKREFFVRLRSGALGVLERRMIQKRFLDDLVLGVEVKVRIVGEHDSVLKVRLVSVSQKPQKEDVEICEVKQILRRDDRGESSSSEESDTEVGKDVIASIGLSKYSVPIISCTEQKEKNQLNVSNGLKWDVEATPNLSRLEQRNGDRPSSDSSDSESDTEKKKSNSGAKDKRNKQKQEEEYLIKQEQRLMNSGLEPETVDDFDRLVLSQPDNSVIWLKYMSFHLQQAEVDKARAVAQRALTTISFREEQEKLNIWFALLNLENLYGTSESLDTTFQKAVQLNDPFKVYVHMANTYTQSGKNQEAEKLYTAMLKKFKMEPQTWLDFALYCLKSGRGHKAHDLFQQCLTSLDKRHHVEVVSKFAQMEFKHGEPERGKTMMEGILTTYPKRTDIWSQYADLLLKNGDIQGTRQILERSISSSLSAKKMKFLFKKYLDFEKQYGTEEMVENLKRKALEYVQKEVTV